MNAHWTVRIERLRTRLRMGTEAHAALQPVAVSLRLRGMAAARPQHQGECIDSEALCRWITEDWPLSAPTPLLETRINQLADYAFRCAPQVHELRVRITRLHPQATAIGIERCLLRAEHEAQWRHAAHIATENGDTPWKTDPASATSSSSLAPLSPS